MNKKIKLLAIVLAVIIVLSVVALTTNSVEEEKAPELPIKIACIGDSITNISGYPDDLWMLLGANYTLGEFGVSAATASLHSYTAYARDPEFEAAKNFQPKIVIIMLGTNDAIEEFQTYRPDYASDYKQIVTAFQALPSKPQIWLVLPPPIHPNGYNVTEASLTKNVIPAIKQIANEANLPIIDVYTALQNHPEAFIDGIHPNSRGAQMIAQTIYNAITRQIK